MDSININNQPELLQNQREQQKSMLDNDTFFPKGVHIDDIDRVVRDTLMAACDMESMENKGQKIPFFSFFSLKSYTESVQTWKNVDTKKAIMLPFFALVRESITDKGTNLSSNYNIPSNPTFPLLKRPIIRNGRKSYDYYQIPQPVNIDIKYVLHFFSYMQRECNKVDELILHLFKSSQYYMNIWGHYMPLKKESVRADDESGSIEQRRYYHHSYDLTLKGYLLREEDFKKIPSIDKVSIEMDKNVGNAKQSRECQVDSLDLDCDLCLSFKFNRKSGNSKTVRISQSLEFYYDNMSNAQQYNYFLNNQLVQLPFTANMGDELTVAHNISYAGTIEIKVCARKL